MWFPSGRGSSAQHSPGAQGSSECPSALFSNGALASTSFQPSFSQQQDGSNSADKLRYKLQLKYQREGGAPRRCFIAAYSGLSVVKSIFFLPRFFSFICLVIFCVGLFQKKRGILAFL